MPPGRWNSIKAASRLRTLAYSAEGSAFERFVCELLRFAHPDVVPSQPLGSLDRRGVDILVFGPRGDLTFPIVVQAKGFAVAQRGFGNSQLEQCQKSITSFRQSGIRADRYILALNRYIDDESHRDAIQKAVAAIQTDGLARIAELVDVNELVSRALDGANNIALQSLDAMARRLSNERLARLSPICTPLETVPVERQSMDIDQHRLCALTPRQANSEFIDPLSLIPAKGRIVFVGEAGAGKTTLAQRLLAQPDRHIAYLPGASIEKGTNGANDLLSHLGLADVFALDGIRPEICREAARAVLDHILKDPTCPILLFIDAIDESFYLSKRGGLQTLFNQLREVRVPVVITVRTGLWRQRLPEFSRTEGPSSCDPSKRRPQQLPVVSLLDWEDSHIAQAIRRRLGEGVDPPAQAHLQDFLELVESGTYQRDYGTIPRTPLFLKFVLDTVEDHGARPTDRAALLDEWAERKIGRDVSEPREINSEGRIPIVEGAESIGATIHYANEIMEHAAAVMTVWRDRGRSIEMKGYCKFATLKARCPELLRNAMEPTGLTLNTLLVVANRPSRHIPDLTFCHRIFQEYFLARDVVRRPQPYIGWKLPAEIEGWLEELRLTESC